MINNSRGPTARRARDRLAMPSRFASSEAGSAKPRRAPLASGSLSGISCPWPRGQYGLAAASGRPSRRQSARTVRSHDSMPAIWIVAQDRARSASLPMMAV